MDPLRPEQRHGHLLPGVATDRHRPPEPLRDHLPLVLPPLRLPLLPKPPRADDVAPGPAPRGGSQRLQPAGGPRPGAGRIRTGGPSLGARTPRSSLADRPPGRGVGRRRPHRVAGHGSLDVLDRFLRLPPPAHRHILRPAGRTRHLAGTEAGLAVGGGGPHVRRRCRHLPGGPGPGCPGDQQPHPPQRAGADRRRHRLAGRGGTRPLRKGIEPVRWLRLPHRSYHRKRAGRGGCRRCRPGRPPQRAPAHPVGTPGQHVPVRGRGRDSRHRLPSRSGCRAGGAGPQCLESTGDLRLPCRGVPELLRGHVRRRRLRPAGHLAGQSDAQWGCGWAESSPQGC